MNALSALMRLPISCDIAGGRLAAVESLSMTAIGAIGTSRSTEAAAGEEGALVAVEAASGTAALSGLSLSHRGREPPFSSGSTQRCPPSRCRPATSGVAQRMSSEAAVLPHPCPRLEHRRADVRAWSLYAWRSHSPPSAPHVCCEASVDQIAEGRALVGGSAGVAAIAHSDGRGAGGTERARPPPASHGDRDSDRDQEIEVDRTRRSGHDRTRRARWLDRDHATARLQASPQARCTRAGTAQGRSDTSRRAYPRQISSSWDDLHRDVAPVDFDERSSAALRVVIGGQPLEPRRVRRSSADGLVGSPIQRPAAEPPG